MSTRATYEFRDEYGSHTVYKHHDGYPSGAKEWITAAIEKAWPLGRFEADDFGAAFVAANKDDGGGVRLAKDRDDYGDTEYHYVVTFEDGHLVVEQFEPSGNWENRRWQSVGKWALSEWQEGVAS